MANRPKGFGMTAELADKNDAKYNEQLAAQAMEWIQDITQESCPGSSQDEVHAHLKNGQLLCKLMNSLKPGSVKKVNTSTMAFKMMENIGNFLTAAEGYGAKTADMFQTVDLFEKQNMPQVINGIHALGRAAQKNGYGGPTIGVKESQTNKREFTDEQLRAGDGIIGLQAGSNKGASQAGLNMGKSRHILD